MTEENKTRQGLKNYLRDKAWRFCHRVLEITGNGSAAEEQR